MTFRYSIQCFDSLYGDRKCTEGITPEPGFVKSGLCLTYPC